jgi:hypothetical protein
LIEVSFLGFFKQGNDTIAYFTSLYMISLRYIQPECSLFGEIQGVKRVQTVDVQELGFVAGIGTENKWKTVEYPVSCHW